MWEVPRHNRFASAQSAPLSEHHPMLTQCARKLMAYAFNDGTDGKMMSKVVKLVDTCKGGINMNASELKTIRDVLDFAQSAKGKIYDHMKQFTSPDTNEYAAERAYGNLMEIDVLKAAKVGLNGAIDIVTSLDELADNARQCTITAHVFQYERTSSVLWTCCMSTLIIDDTAYVLGVEFSYNTMNSHLNSSVAN